MTREEALKILEDNHCCPIHIGERMSQSPITCSTAWHCWSCVHAAEIRQDQLIKEAADFLKAELQTA